MLIVILRALHLLSMALWFGPGLTAPGDARRTVDSGIGLDGLRTRMMRTGILTGVSGLVTIITGVALIFALGGFKAVPHGIHLGLGLGVLTWLAGALGVGGTARALDQAIEKGADKAAQQALVKRLAMTSGIFQLLWTLTFLSMVFRGLIP